MANNSSSIGNTQPKMNATKEFDELFGEESPKDKNNASDDDEIFGGESVKSKKESEDDIFDTDAKPNKLKDDQMFEDEDDDDDPFADHEEEKKEEYKQSATTKPAVMKDDIKPGDLFTAIKFRGPEKEKVKDQNKPFRYFGELQDVNSIYQVSYDSYKKMKTMIFSQSKCPMTIEKTDKETIKIFERVRPEEVRNKKLIESKLFDKLSMYKFRNKRLDNSLTLGLLPQGKYSKVNSENKVEKIALLLETEKARRDLGFNLEENMDKLYDIDIRQVIGEIDSKRRKDYEDKHGIEMPEEDRAYAPKATEQEEISSKLEQDMLETNDIDDVSSIDSDTKEEEKKFKVHDSVLGGVQNVMSSNISDLLQHAKCFTFEYMD